MKKMTKRVLGILLAAGMLLSSTACNSPGGSTAGGKEEKFPSKQVTIIMPWSLGGGPDTIARQVASYGEKYLGVPVIVENKTGGAGTIAMTAAVSTLISPSPSSTTIKSGWAPCATLWHEAHAPHGRGEAPVHRSAAAMVWAKSVFPLPSGPDNRTACGKRRSSAVRRLALSAVLPGRASNPDITVSQTVRRSARIRSRRRP